MKKTIIILLVLVLVFSANAFAMEKNPACVSSVSETGLRSIGNPSISLSGTTATCSAVVTSSGKTINLTLELWQGDTLIDSWSKTGTSMVTISGTATIIHGLTYTLTLSGTINGVPFTPRSITKTL